MTNADRSRVWLNTPGFQLAVERLVTRFRLSGAQARVLVPLVLAYEDPEIATMLFVSRETVRSHVKAILHSVGTSSRKDLMRVFLVEIARVSDTTP